MIQTQTLALDNDTKAELVALSKEIAANADRPDFIAPLIKRHDELTKSAPLKLYDQREETCS